MPGKGGVLYRSAPEVCSLNSESDEVLWALVERVPERCLHDEFSDFPRTLAQQLGHLGEFPAFFAAQLEDWLDRRRLILGRVGAHDPDFHDGLVRATELRLATLVTQLDGSLKRLDHALRRLQDEHLRVTTHNVSRGREPLTSFLNRYILDHKATHAAELQATLDAL